MSGGSLAYRQYEKLRVNRARQLAKMRARLTELGDDRGLRELDTMMAEFGATGPQFPDDPVGEGLTEMVGNVKDALADLGASRTALDDVWAVALNRDTFSARMTRFTDDSGLVTVSDATVSLCGLYAQALGLAGQRGPETQVLTGLLRYYTTQQRVFGLAGKMEIRLEPMATQYAILLQYMSAQFVLAHELAHYVLGHASSVSAFAPDEYLPVCSESHQLEAEADLHALRAVRRACERLFDDLPSASEQAALGAVGAAIGMLAVHVTERALFVRRGASHPPARQRAAALLREMNPEERKLAQEALDLALDATEAASGTGAGAVSFTSEMFGSAPIHTPLDPSYLRTTEVCDAIQCRSRDWYVSLFDQAAGELGLPWLADGARLAAEDDPAGALRTWGVPKGNIGALCDPQQPLTFYALYLKLRAAFTAGGMQASHLLTYALAAATLVGEPLGGETGQTTADRA
ncbi:hypothetical protein JIX56_22400 [Streptomyces sp. CA-210063]|uniref:hypothetical protein n=1 Tax=Streptomyces sp. CA-210063 TaxID=2801029 RepID=UPI00214C4D5A|nr:hypothetical protein [Streptomyces sp. CA-210063]UUU32430.1 hypothetical protein JIX56_22400 [Streptomyces sp. CA-210063]